MTEKNTFEQFFDLHAPIYDENVFTKNTMREVDFLLEELKLPSGAAILDVGCGTGRHSIELAKRGYALTGVDFSEGMLAVAARSASAAGVRVEWEGTLPGHFEHQSRHGIDSRVSGRRQHDATAREGRVKGRIHTPHLLFHGPGMDFLVRQEGRKEFEIESVPENDIGLCKTPPGQGRQVLQAAGADAHHREPSGRPGHGVSPFSGVFRRYP